MDVKVRMLAWFRSNGPGDVCLLPEEEAARLVKLRAAEYVGEAHPDRPAGKGKPEDAWPVSQRIS